MSAHVLLIEGDALLRGEIVKYLLSNRNRVTACGSIAEATTVLTDLPSAVAPDAIMSGVFLVDGDGIGFFLRASLRFPQMRWIVTATGCAAEPYDLEARLPATGVAKRRGAGVGTGLRRGVR